MNRAQAELKAFEKRYGIAELNRSKNKGTGEVDDRVLKEWAAKTKAYGDASKAADTKQKMVWDRAEQRGGMDEQGKAELRGFGRDSDRIQVTRGINKPDNTADNTYRSAASQARSEDYARQQNRQQRQTSQDEDRRRQDMSGQIRQATRDLREAGPTEQDRRFNERVAGYGQDREYRRGQDVREMQERSGKGRRYGRLAGRGQREGGYGFRGIEADSFNDMARDRGVAPRGGQRGGGRSRRRKPDVGIPTPPKGIITKPTRDLNGGRNPIHGDFNRPSGPSTQAIVPWINRETGEEWNAPSGGYSPREGSGWERDRGDSKKTPPSMSKPPSSPADVVPRNDYVRPWDKEGWGSDDIARTAPKDPTESKYGRWQDAELPSKWWEEPKKEYRPEKTDKEKRLELLTGGTGTGGGSSYSDRQALLTGRGLSSNEDRMAMLTGESDPPKEEWQSQYGGGREYDPQDREFNKQFNTEPTDNRDVRSWFPDSEPSRPVSKPSSSPADVISKPPSSPTDVGPGTVYPYGKPDPSHPPDVMYSKDPGPAPDTNQKYDDSRVRERLRALEGRPQTGGWQEDRIKALENRPQSTGGNWDEARIKALESRDPIVNQPTVDLSGVQGRLDKLEGRSGWDENRIAALEGRGSGWDEDRIAKLEGRKPQDLSGIQGRLTNVEGRTDDTSWKDRLAKLENYYKNDPPPADSTGNRYEDKMAAILKGWDMTGKATKWDPADSRLGGYSNDRSGKAWSDQLQQGYIQEVRDLNREYNKPVHTAQIKGREYKAYDPQAATRLRYLDDQNMHEDQYLGSGTWQNQYGEDVKGRNMGHQPRYFASQSGLDKDSVEYKDRFSAYGGMGKDYAWYK